MISLRQNARNHFFTNYFNYDCKELAGVLPERYFSQLVRDLRDLRVKHVKSNPNRTMLRRECRPGRVEMAAHFDQLVGFVGRLSSSGVRVEREIFACAENPASSGVRWLRLVRRIGRSKPRAANPSSGFALE